MVTDPASEGWHLDRRIPLVLVIAILSNLVVGTWFVADLYHNVNQQSDKIANIIIQVKELDDRSDALKENLITLGADVRHGNKETEKVRRLLEKFIDQQQEKERQQFRNGNSNGFNSTPRQ